MSKLVKKLLVSLFASLVLLMSVAPAINVKAADLWYSPDFKSFYTKVYGGDDNEIFGERYTAAQVEWVFWGFLSMIINLPLNIICGSPKPLVAILSGDASQFQCKPFGLGSIPGPSNVASQGNKNLLSLVFAERQFSGITYVKDIARKFSLIPNAYAQVQGFGYGALDPILPLWTAVRNISYSLFIIVIIILAFMIMFRVKISPQVVVGVQSALPKIAIALVLVTFSYAIAGFLIDLMYVVIGLISLVIGGGAGGNSGQIFINMTTPSWGIVGLIGFYLLFSVLGFASVVGKAFATGTAAGIGGGALAAIVLAIVLVVLIIASIFIFFKIVWLILKTLVNVFLLTVFAPIQFVFGVVASNLSFSSWVRNFVANLAVFPVIGLFFSLSYMFLAAVIQSYFPGEPYSKVYVVNSLLIRQSGGSSGAFPPLFSIPGVTDQTALLYLALGVGIFFMIPKAGDIVRSMIEGKPIAYGAAIGEAIGGAAGIAALPIQQRRGEQEAMRRAELEQKIKGLEHEGASNDQLAKARELRAQLSQMELSKQIMGGVTGQLKNILK